MQESGRFPWQELSENGESLEQYSQGGLPGGGGLAALILEADLRGERSRHGPLGWPPSDILPLVRRQGPGGTPLVSARQFQVMWPPLLSLLVLRRKPPLSRMQALSPSPRARWVAGPDGARELLAAETRPRRGLGGARSAHALTPQPCLLPELRGARTSPDLCCLVPFLLTPPPPPFSPGSQPWSGRGESRPRSPGSGGPWGPSKGASGSKREVPGSGQTVATPDFLKRGPPALPRVRVGIRMGRLGSLPGGAPLQTRLLSFPDASWGRAGRPPLTRH